MVMSMRGIGCFISRYWQGDLSYLTSFAGVLFGIHVAAALVLSGLHGSGRAVVGAAVALQTVVLIWQCVGMFRAADRSFQGHGGAQLAALSYVAILAVVGSTLYQVVSLLASGPVDRPAFVSEPMSLIVSGNTIRLEGEITLRHFTELDHLLAGGHAARVLVLDSDGGNIPAARGIARLVETGGFETMVDGRCFSACTLAFMAGARRTLVPGSRMGFHRYRTGLIEQSGHQLYGDISEEQSKDRRYFQRRGVADGFLDRIYDAAPDDMWQPSEAEMRQAGVLIGD